MCKQSEQGSKKLRLLSGYSFEIYLIHIVLKSFMQFGETPLPVITDNAFLTPVFYFVTYTFVPLGIILLFGETNRFRFLFNIHK
jgi:hypothetical protein